MRTHSASSKELPRETYRVVVAKDSPSTVLRLGGWLKIEQFLGHVRYARGRLYTAIAGTPSATSLLYARELVGCKVLPEGWRVGEGRGEGVRLLLVSHLEGSRRRYGSSH